MTLIKLEEVTLAYHDLEVVRCLSLEVGRGEVVGLIGPNGSGKSTIIKAASGVLRPRRGAIRINGKYIDELSPRELARQIAVVPQAPRLPENFTALELVLLGRTPHLGLLRFESRRDIEICLKAMELTGCRELALRRLGELSGGERQRVVLARALAQESMVLLLDEPTAHLDIHHQVEILSLVRRLCSSQGMAALIALHDLNLASRFCHRLFLLKDGVVCAEGTPGEVLTTENLLRAYGSGVEVYTHPADHLPIVLPQPREE